MSPDELPETGEPQPLDMDGVLCDFHGAACKIHGRQPSPWPAGKWDIAAELGLTDRAFWDPIEAMGATGDGNGDGRCTEVDALLALQMAVGLEPPIVETMDVNSDGSITEVDALMILQWAVTGGQCGS